MHCDWSIGMHWLSLKVDMHILTCIYFTFDWLNLTSEMHFVKFHPEVASCLLSRGKRKYAPLGMRLLWKYIRNYFLVYQLISHFWLYLQNYKELEAEILDLQSEKYGLSFHIKKYTTSGWALGDENVISIRAFKQKAKLKYEYSTSNNIMSLLYSTPPPSINTISLNVSGHVNGFIFTPLCFQSFRDTVHYVSCCETNFQEARYSYIANSLTGPIWPYSITFIMVNHN